MSQVTQPPTAPMHPPAAREPGPPGRNWLPAVRVVAVVVVLLLLALGTVAVVSTFVTRKHTDVRTIAGRVTMVRITTDVGDVNVRPSAAADRSRVEADVTESFGGAHWDAALKDGTLEVSGGCDDTGIGFFDCDVDFDVDAPPGVPVVVASNTGDLWVTGGFAAVDAHTQTGDVLVQDATGPVKIRTNTGDVRSLGARSKVVTAETSTGDVRLSFGAVPDSASAETNTGDVTILVPDDGGSYAVSTDTDTGDEHVDVANVPGSQHAISARTDTGDIKVTYDD